MNNYLEGDVADQDDDDEVGDDVDDNVELEPVWFFCQKLIVFPNHC